MTNALDNVVTYVDDDVDDVDSQTTDVFGCMNSLAANYNASATIDDGSCFIVGYSDGVLRLDGR